MTNERKFKQMKKSLVYIQYAKVILLIGMLPLILSCKQEDNNAEYKNVVVIVSDDHAYKAAGCYGNSLVQTPNIDALAQNGIRFTNAYCNSPICSASRQSMLTGKYSHNTGVNLLFTPFNDQTNYTIAEHLKENGYKTGLVGKTHFNEWVYADYWEEWPTYGFESNISSEDWKKFLRKDEGIELPPDLTTRKVGYGRKDVAWLKNADFLPQPYYDAGAEGTFFAHSAMDFMNANKENPFFLWVAFHEPHAPFAFPIEFANTYQTDSIVLPSGSAEDDRWIPKMFRGLSDKEKQGIIAAYYTSVSYMDKNVGLILDKINDLGLADNTLVIYVSDNGYLLYDHKRFEKHTMWKESVKVPFIIRGKGLNPQVSSELVELIDLAPTIFEAVGLDIPDKVEGKSLLPLLKGSSLTHKGYVFSEYLEDNLMMIANKKFKYIFSTGKRDLGMDYATGYGPSGVSHFLYDLQNDPNETTNLYKSEAHKSTLKEMQLLMLEHLKNSHPDAQKVPENLNVIGQLIWFAEPRDIGDEPGEVMLERIFEIE